MFSTNVFAQNIIDSGTINILKESFKSARENTVISGLSISFATDMLTNGATGNSLEQLTRFIGMSIEDKNNELHEKITHLPSTLEISNSIWGDYFKESYKSLLTQILDVSVEKLPENTSVINGWIAEKNHDKITNILDVKPTESDDLFLVNTIYFKDSWDIQFKKENTFDEKFHTLMNGDINIPMMHRTDRMLYAENTKVQSVKLPYENGGYMIVYLPRKDVDFNDFIANLTVEDMDLEYTSQRVSLTLPKMKIEKKTNVKEIFQQIGITDIFKPGDLDNISGGAYVTDIVHQAIVEVDEEGTVAAAATVVSMTKSISAAPQPTIHFIANRPFLFLITQGDFIGVYTGK